MYKNPEREVFDYVEKPSLEELEDSKIIYTTKKQGEYSTDKPLSNINEESDDHSYNNAHQMTPEPFEKQVSEKENISKSSKHFYHQCEEARQEEFLNAQQNINRKVPSRPYNENGHVADGINQIIKFFIKAQGRFLYELHKKSLFMERKQSKSQTKIQSAERRSNFVDPKKKKPMIKNNFETEDNDESNHERGTKMTHMQGNKRFESEEERRKGEREKILENRLEELSSQLGQMYQRMQCMEYEIARLNKSNAELEEHNRYMYETRTENCFVVMPYTAVKRIPPFKDFSKEEFADGSYYLFRTKNEDME